MYVIIPDTLMPVEEYAAAGNMFEALMCEDVNRTTDDFKNKLSTIVHTLQRGYEEGSFARDIPRLI